MSTVSAISEWHVLCTAPFVVPLRTRTPQPLALFLWGEKKQTQAVNHLGINRKRAFLWCEYPANFQSMYKTSLMPKYFFQQHWITEEIIAPAILVLHKRDKAVNPSSWKSTFSDSPFGQCKEVWAHNGKSVIFDTWLFKTSTSTVWVIFSWNTWYILWDSSSMLLWAIKSH